MKRYLAFGSEQEPRAHLRDFLSDHDELVMAKAAVEVCDPDGFTTYLTGAVLDTKTGQVHEFESDGRAFGRLNWRFPRDAAA